MRTCTFTMRPEQSAISKRERAGARRRGREFCLALLYASDAGVGGTARAWAQAEDILTSLVEEWRFSPLETRKLRPAVSEFGRALCEEYLSHREDIDQRIDRLSQGWTLERMPVVDRNILRMAMAELLYLGDIPIGATIDEAVDLAKEYGTSESGKFVNGILGTVARELQQTRKVATPGSAGLQASVPPGTTDVSPVAPCPPAPSPERGGEEPGPGLDAAPPDADPDVPLAEAD